MAWIPRQNRCYAGSEWDEGEASVLPSGIEPPVDEGFAVGAASPASAEAQTAREQIASAYVDADPICLPSREEHEAQLAETELRQSTLGVWGDGTLRTVGEEQSWRQDEYVRRSLDQLTSGPIGAMGNGLGRAVSDDPDRQLAIGDLVTTVGTMAETVGIGAEINHPPELPPRVDFLQSERAPRSRVYEDYQAQDSAGRAAANAPKLDRGPKDHGHADHGAHTTYEQQATRVETGVTPSGRSSKTPRATRFESDAAQLEAVGRARSQVEEAQPPKYATDTSGAAIPNRTKKIVGGRKGGYGSGAELERGGDGRQKMPLTAKPTGSPDPNAQVILRYDPLSDDWTPITSFPTNEGEKKQ